MNDMTYRVVFEGKIADGESIEQVKEKLAAILKSDMATLDRLFSGKKKTIKKNATHEQCQRFQKTFEAAGALCAIEPETSPTEDNNTAANALPQPPPLPRQTRRGNGDISPPARRPDERFCEACGAVIKINALSCPHCGKKIKKSDGIPGCAIAAIIAGVFFVLIAIVGILAAIAIPNFIAYRNKAYQSQVKTEMTQLYNAEKTYFQAYGRYTTNLAVLDYTPALPNVTVEVVAADADCFQAKGTMREMRQAVWIDCYGTQQLTDQPGESVK